MVERMRATPRHSPPTRPDMMGRAGRRRRRARRTAVDGARAGETGQAWRTTRSVGSARWLNSRVDLPTAARTANAPNPSCACALQFGVARAAVCRACVTRRTSGICCAHRCICAFMWSTMPTDALIWRRSRAPVMLPTRRALLRFVVAPSGGASGRTKLSNLEQLLPAQMRTHSCERPCQLTRSSPDGRVHC